MSSLDTRFTGTGSVRCGIRATEHAMLRMLDTSARQQAKCNVTWQKKFTKLHGEISVKSSGSDELSSGADDIMAIGGNAVFFLCLCLFAF